MNTADKASTRVHPEYASGYNKLRTIPALPVRKLVGAAVPLQMQLILTPLPGSGEPHKHMSSTEAERASKP